MYTISNRFQVCYQSKCSLKSPLFETRSFFFFSNIKDTKKNVQFQTPSINEVFFFRFAILGQKNKRFETNDKRTKKKLNCDQIEWHKLDCPRYESFS